MALSLVIGIASSQHSAQPATAEETQVILEAIGLGDSSSSSWDRVVEFQAWRYPDRFSEGHLVGFVWLRPYPVRGEMCIGPEYAVSGYPKGDSYEWVPQRTFHHWLVEQGACEILDSSEIPPEAVVTRESIPTDSLLRLMKEADELLRRTLEHPSAAQLLDRVREWRLTEVSVSHDPMPVIGFVYHAQFAAEGMTKGPSVVFSFSEGGGFDVHDVGLWMY